MSRLVSRVKRIAVAGLLLAGVLAGFHALSPTPQERLTAFDAVHAVPDEDNAAVLYAELLQGEPVSPSELAAELASLADAIQDPVSARESRASQTELRGLVPPKGIHPNMVWSAASHPWKSIEHPELKSWLDTHRDRIERMLEAAQKPVCRFPLSPEPGQMGLFDVPLRAFRQSVLLLCAAAGNDLGEGDVDAALEKWHALMTTGRHLRDQPNSSSLLYGVVVEAMALDRFKEFVVEGPATDRQLHDVATECEKGDRPWESVRRDINRARDLASQVLEDQRSFKFRMYTKYRRICYGERGWFEGRYCELCHRMLADRRGVRILIELRRFKGRTGRWPESLDLIASSLPAGSLIDPINGRFYVYRLSESGFSLYSIGLNRLDENGRHTSIGPDDWPIWPPKGRAGEPEPQDMNEL